MLAREGLNPRFSPDGSQVAYWIGDENVDNRVPGSGAVWVMLAAGGNRDKWGQTSLPPAIRSGLRMASAFF